MKTCEGDVLNKMKGCLALILKEWLPWLQQHAAVQVCIYIEIAVNPCAHDTTPEYEVLCCFRKVNLRF